MQYQGSTALFVGDLSTTCTEEDLIRVFSNFGRVENARVQRYRNTMVSRGYGFVKMATVPEAITAKEHLHGYLLCGRRMKVRNAEFGVKASLSLRNSLHFTYVSTERHCLTNESKIREIFSVAGEVADVSIRKATFDRTSGISRGYGFIHFLDSDDGLNAALYVIQNIPQIAVEGVTYNIQMSKNFYRQLAAGEGDSMLGLNIPKNSDNLLDVGDMFGSGEQFGSDNDFIMSKSGSEYFNQSQLGSSSGKFMNRGNDNSNNSMMNGSAYYNNGNNMSNDCSMLFRSYSAPSDIHGGVNAFNFNNHINNNNDNALNMSLGNMNGIPQQHQLLPPYHNNTNSNIGVNPILMMNGGIATDFNTNISNGNNNSADIYSHSMRNMSISESGNFALPSFLQEGNLDTAKTITNGIPFVPSQNSNGNNNSNVSPLNNNASRTNSSFSETANITTTSDSVIENNKPVAAVGIALGSTSFAQLQQQAVPQILQALANSTSNHNSNRNSKYNSSRNTPNIGELQQDTNAGGDSTLLKDLASLGLGGSTNYNVISNTVNPIDVLVTTQLPTSQAFLMSPHAPVFHASSAPSTPPPNTAAFRMIHNNSQNGSKLMPHFSSGFQSSVGSYFDNNQSSNGFGQISSGNNNGYNDPPNPQQNIQQLQRLLIIQQNQQQAIGNKPSNYSLNALTPPPSNHGHHHTTHHHNNRGNTNNMIHANMMNNQQQQQLRGNVGLMGGANNFNSNMMMSGLNGNNNSNFSNNGIGMATMPFNSNSNNRLASSNHGNYVVPIPQNQFYNPQPQYESK